MTNENSPVAVVTGASRGIGRAIALGLAKRGYDVALVARDETKLSQVKTEIEALGQQAGVFALDVTDRKAVNETIEHVHKSHGHIDVLFNNAGVFTANTSEADPEGFDKMLEINLTGMFNFVHAIAPIMKQQRSGYIFNVASRAGKLALPNGGVYALTKYGVVGFNEALFSELAPFHVKTTALCPSVIATDMTKKFGFKDEDKIQLEDMVKTVNYCLDLGPTAFIKDLDIHCGVAIEMLTPKFTTMADDKLNT